MTTRRSSRLPRSWRSGPAGRTALAAAAVGMVLAALFASLPSAARVRPTPERATAIVDPALANVRSGEVDVIVQGDDSAGTERAVSLAGGTVTKFLPMVNGLAATVPADGLAELSGAQGVRIVSLDRQVQVQGGGASTAADSEYRKAVRSDETVRAGKTGQGVTVALIDTGIAPVPDLHGRVRTITDDITGATSACVNLSGENSCADSYGHGTFIAGIIAGNGSASNGEHAGVAPGADLVSIKIAGPDGSADVSNVIAGIQWAVSFKDRYGIKVLNLSLGTDGTQSYRTDPLNFAVEKAWDAGIVVVVAASNRGPAPRTISKPGDDPWVITVGAVDDHGTPGLGDDTLPNFSSRGPTAADGLAKPDLVAPGAHVVSLRAPGSAIDTQFPNYVDGAYRRGSGTSMATGVASGSVALMLEANPGMAPNRVKHALTSTARRVASDDRMAVGAGMLDTYAAGFAAPPGVANQGLARSNGLGSLDASRGTTRVKIDNSPLGTILYGSLTAQALVWNPILFTTTSWTGSSWYGSSWYGSSWYGSSWYGSSWYGSSWYGSSWYGQPEGSSWYGSSWYGSSWYGGWE